MNNNIPKWKILRYGRLLIQLLVNDHTITPVYFNTPTIWIARIRKYHIGTTTKISFLKLLLQEEQFTSVKKQHATWNKFSLRIKLAKKNLCVKKNWFSNFKTPIGKITKLQPMKKKQKLFYKNNKKWPLNNASPANQKKGKNCSKNSLLQ